MQLDAVQARIRELEAAGPPTTAAPARSWRLETTRAAGGPAILHADDCPLTKAGATLSRTEAVLALDEPSIKTCDICKPQQHLRT